MGKIGILYVKIVNNEVVGDNGQFTENIGHLK